MGWTDDVADFESVEQACLRCGAGFMSVFAGMCGDCRSALNRAAAQEAAARRDAGGPEASPEDRPRLAGQERAVR